MRFIESSTMDYSLNPNKNSIGKHLANDKVKKWKKVTSVLGKDTLKIGYLLHLNM
ncbi:14092_t:CDS:2, partial [Acaulospora morrowiae]